MEPHNNPYIHPNAVPVTPAPAAPAAPQTPAAPAAPAAPVTPEAPADKPLSLEDLFPKDATPQTPAAPQTPAVTPQTPATPAGGEPSDAEKEAARLRDEMAQQAKQTNQKVEDVQQQLNLKIARQSELNGFFTRTENSLFLKHQSEITKVATDPRFVGWSLDRVLAFTLGANNMMRMGGELAVKAYKDAQAGGTGGTQNNAKANNTAGPDYSKMSDAEFAQATSQVMAGHKPQ